MLHVTLTLIASVTAAPDYVTDVKPILTQYCVGCHNPQDEAAGLSLQSYDELQRGSENGSISRPRRDSRESSLASAFSRIGFTDAPRG